MIGRGLSLSIALIFTTGVVGGIAALVALDFIGEEKAFALFSPAKDAPAEPAPQQLQKVVEELPALDGARDITFFKELPIEGLPFKVTTGVRFATPAAFAANLVAERWCYVMAPGPDGLKRQIDLASQKGSADPVFNLLDGLKGDLALFKMGAKALELIARTHCRFDFTTPEEGG